MFVFFFKDVHLTYLYVTLLSWIHLVSSLLSFTNSRNFTNLRAFIFLDRTEDPRKRYLDYPPSSRETPDAPVRDVVSKRLRKSL